jgi:hypothetical protein
VLQRAESGKLRHAQRDCVLERSDQSVGRVDLEHHNDIAAVPVGNEADLLKHFSCCRESRGGRLAALPLFVIPSLFVIPEENPRFARISGTISGEEPR